jgi:Dolichyl-phosphate-mannose-protein mannosyltransferase
MTSAAVNFNDPQDGMSQSAFDVTTQEQRAPAKSRGQAWAARVNGLRGERSWPAWIGSVLSRHWLAALLLTAGLVMRIIAQLAYAPAILYIDSVKYLYNAWIAADPVGYKVPLKLLLSVGDLGTVTAFQHLCGLAIAVLIYVLLLRRGVNRWLAALAMAPILLDGYQLQSEQTIMPDVIFELLIVLAFVVLLWKSAPSWTAVIATGLIMGISVTIREVGLFLIVPGLIYLILTRGGRPREEVVGKGLAMVVAFILPVFAYCGYAFASTGDFALSTKGSAAGRLAVAVDCKTIKLPAAAQRLCPTPALQKESPDWLSHASRSPLLHLKGVSATEQTILLSEFDHAVETQQPLRVIGSILRDSIRLFAVDRANLEAITPISRWQFQDRFPTYPGVIEVHHGTIVLGVQLYHSQPFHYHVLPSAWGGKAKVNVSLASFLRAYQLNYGYTPGPLLLLFTILGLIGSLIGLVPRWSSPRGRNLAYAALVCFVSAVGLLLVADLYTFSWRYQLMALVTLPLAGVLGFSALVDVFRRRRAGDGAGGAGGAEDAGAAGAAGAASADATVA